MLKRAQPAAIAQTKQRCIRCAGPVPTYVLAQDPRVSSRGTGSCRAAGTPGSCEQPVVVRAPRAGPQGEGSGAGQAAAAPGGAGLPAVI